MGYTGRSTKATFRQWLEMLKRKDSFSAGYFYCPYIPLMDLAGITAAGKAELENLWNVLGASGNLDV